MIKTNIVTGIIESCLMYTVIFPAPIGNECHRHVHGATLHCNTFHCIKNAGNCSNLEIIIIILVVFNTVVNIVQVVLTLTMWVFAHEM